MNTDTKMHHLNDTWILWYHDTENSDWSKKSYKKVMEIDSIEAFWGVYNQLPSVINGMWFLMRAQNNGVPIYPMWEDPACVMGGAWLFKIHKSLADNAWLDLSQYMIGESICSDSEQIMGLSISPKKHYVTIRVWNRDKNNLDISVFPTKISNVDFKEALYKAHS